MTAIILLQMKMELKRVKRFILKENPHSQVFNILLWELLIRQTNLLRVMYGWMNCA